MHLRLLNNGINMDLYWFSIYLWRLNDLALQVLQKLNNGWVVMRGGMLFPISFQIVFILCISCHIMCMLCISFHIMFMFWTKQSVTEFQQRNWWSFNKGSDGISVESGELSGGLEKDMLEFRQGIWKSSDKDMVEF